MIDTNKVHLYKYLVLPVLRGPADTPLSNIKIKTEKKFNLAEDHFIVCRNCGNCITVPENIIVVDGDHSHRFANPEGFVYNVGCFSAAEGCIVYGDPTLDHTWFDGFTWSFSICSGCLFHLGWYYERGDESFFGLILDQLTDSASTH